MEHPKQFTPVPDPTLLTTAALRQAIEGLRDYFDAKIIDLKELLEEKINSTNHLKEEKFKETWDRLNLMENQRLESKADNEKAIDSALLARERIFTQAQACSEEASRKQDAAVDKQLDSIRILLSSNVESLRDKITGLKERMDRGLGQNEQSDKNKISSQWIVGLIIVSGISLLGDALMAIHLFTK